jgi:hypothetical protein
VRLQSAGVAWVTPISFVIGRLKTLNAYRRTAGIGAEETAGTETGLAPCRHSNYGGLADLRVSRSALYRCRFFAALGGGSVVAAGAGDGSIFATRLEPPHPWRERVAVD